MGAPAVKAGDQVQGLCAGHQIPSPVGSPMPGPPMPFSAQLTLSLASSVMIGGSPAAVVGSKGYNTPPHVGLHPSDTKLVPITQEAEITVGSSTVLIENKGAAYTGCTATACMAVSPIVTGTASTVLIGS